MYISPQPYNKTHLCKYFADIYINICIYLFLFSDPLDSMRISGKVKGG